MNNMSKLWIVMLSLSATLSVAACTLVDFSEPVAAAGCKVAAGRFAKSEDAARQIAVGTNGMTVLFDSSLEGKKTGWATIDLSRAVVGERDWSTLHIRLVLSGVPTGKALRNIALNLTDAGGETFQYFPTVFDSGDGNLNLEYDFAAGGRSRGWGGDGNNRIDPPARLSALNVHFDGKGTGSVTFSRIESVGASVGAKRTVLSRETVSTDTAYPGARPFNGLRSLAFDVSPSASGTTRLTLSSGSIGNASQGHMDSFDGVVSNGVARFNLNLPYDRQYEFMKLEVNGRPASPPSGVGEFMQTEAEAMRLEVDTGNPLHLVRDETEKPSLVVRNPAEQTVSWQTVFVFADIFGRRFEIPFSRKMPAKSEVRVDVPWPLPVKGVWYVTAKVKGADGSTARKGTQFAFISRHEVTPRLERPAFRLGIHWHGWRYPAAIRSTAVDALVASGAKLTRTDYGFLFSEVESKEGAFNWKGGDDIAERMRRAGLAMDVITGGAPEWAIDKEASWKSAKALRRPGCRPTRPGVFREYCRALAERYGNKIDYYEIGNEWDITPSDMLSHEEALRMQREAYEGIHAAYPGACVTPNGWAYAATTDHMRGNPAHYNIGLIEAFADHPELYDAWALHVHGGFGHYQHRIDDEFLPMRARTGLKRRPWLSNETALTSAHGCEDIVARAVWMKPLFAWSRGAVDYIWYNLRATGWFNGGEPGYGLMTPDFHPRAGYAAFSALTELFHGLSFDRTIVSEGTRHLFAFHGKVGGEAAIVLAGWDAAFAENPDVVRVKTDAHRAITSDIMGNRADSPVSPDGVAKIALSSNPAALVLFGATTCVATVPSPSVNAGAPARALAMGVTGRPPDFVLDKSLNVHDLYAADPSMAHRTWRGPQDLSARIWIGRDGGALAVRAEVRDDVHMEGDKVEVWMDGGARRVLGGVSQKGDLSVYEGRFTLPRRDFALDLRVIDDDGGGVDGWLMLHGEDTPAPRWTLNRKGPSGDAQPLDYIDPLIGTKGNGSQYGGMMPMTGVPFGSIQWVPMTRLSEVGILSYNEIDTQLLGFIGTRQPSIWMGDWGQMSFMPRTGSVDCDFATRGTPFDHADEDASPWHTRISSGGIVTEFAGTSRAAVYAIRFPPGAETPHLVVDASRDYVKRQTDKTPADGFMSIGEDRRTITGWNADRLDAHHAYPLPNFKGWFVMEFSRPFASWGTYSGVPQGSGYQGVKQVPGNREAQANRVGGWVTFAPGCEELVVKVGVSLISAEQARANLRREIPEEGAGAVDAVAARARAAWAAQFARLTIETPREDVKTIFYTGLFHALLYPREIDEYGRYYSAFDDRVHDGRMYNCYSLWDTYRAEHSLLAFVAPERVDGMMQALVEMSREGGWLPKWPNPSYTGIMIGAPAEMVLAEAWTKGFRGFDVKAAYAAVKKNATIPQPTDEEFRWEDRGLFGRTPETRGGLSSYMSRGWVACDRTTESVSRTQDFSLNDTAAAILAEAVGDASAAAYFRSRAHSWTNVWNAARGYFLPRRADGSWDDPTCGDHYCECSVETALWCVPHDVDRLVRLMGGAATFERRLDTFFDTIFWKPYHGNFSIHGNEPSHHIAYLYNHVGAYDKTAQRVRDILTRSYSTDRKGFDGNEDCGQMSAWYILSALGFYPLNPVDGWYEIGSPLVDRATVRIGAPYAPATLSIVAHNQSPTNWRVKAVSFNRRPLSTRRIHHNELVRGGELVFEMCGNE